MDRQLAERLGKLLRQLRHSAGLSTHSLSSRSGIGQSTIVRIERGEFISPDREKLHRVAQALQIDLADVMAEAGYPVVTEELRPTTYLRAKFRELPAESLEALQRDVARVLRKHGVDPASGPESGEDQGSPTKKAKATKRREATKKGGKP